MQFPKGFLEKIVPFLAKDMYLEHFKKPEDFYDNIEYHFKKGFSVNWCLGGTYGSCWDNELRHVSAEAEPELTELDNFLMAGYPQTSFMQFRKISHCIESSTYSNSDYYGGSTQHGKKSLSFDSLATTLVDLELETDVDLIDAKTFCEQWFIENVNNTPKSKKNKKIK